MLSYVEGAVPEWANPGVVTDGALADVGRLMRALHVAVDGFVLPPGLSWHHRSLGGPKPHVVCHHDLAPRNTVFRDGRAVAFIDWDMATPEAPINDLVHAAWQFVPLVRDEESVRQCWTAPPNRSRRLRRLLDAYDPPAEWRVGFAARVAERMTVTATGINLLAANGEPAFVRLAEDGVPASILLDRAWVMANADALDTAIQSPVAD
jgi:aminoglycoside phosphotransferase (APT) family kinase protein